MELHLLSTTLLEQYKAEVAGYNLSNSFSRLTDAPISTANFSFYTSVASVFSSKIEGEDIDMDAYVKHKRFDIEFSPDYTRKIDDLYAAYQFAQGAALTKENIAAAHALLTKHILSPNQQGILRNNNMYVTTEDGRIEYVAASPFDLPAETEKLYTDIQTLLAQQLSIEKVFFFASLIHLVFVKIHPWNDGNGRTARLLEKWFLASMLGAKAWFIQSEKYYYSQHQVYYNNIRALGIEYPSLNYDEALPFLLMLPQSLNEHFNTQS